MSGIKEIREAIPTEYRGVRFDSKSEAVFARLLDLCGIKWELQHPIRHAGHDWDFLIWNWQDHWFTACEKRSDEGDVVGDIKIYGSGAFTEPVLIELKPRKPCDTYIEQLKRPPGMGERRIVVWGNPWSGQTFDFNGTPFVYMANEPLEEVLGKYDAPLDWFISNAGRPNPFNESHIQSAMRHRFDLP